MSEEIQLKQLQSILQLTEYLASMSRYGRDLNTDDFRSNPLPFLDDENPTKQSLEARLQALVAGVHSFGSSCNLQDNTMTKIQQNSSNSLSCASSQVRGSSGQNKQSNTQHTVKSENQSKNQGKSTAAAQISSVAASTSPAPARGVSGDHRANQNINELFKLVTRVRDCNQLVQSVINLPSSLSLPNYDDLIVYPMSFSLIYARLCVNLQQGYVPDVAPTNEPNMLVNVQYDTVYGALSDYYRQNFGEKFFRSQQEDLCRNPIRGSEAAVRACWNATPPYKYVVEIVRDLFLIAFNIWFYNFIYREWVAVALELMASTRDAFVAAFSELACPSWTHLLDGLDTLPHPQMKKALIAIQSDMRRAKNYKNNVDIYAYTDYLAIGKEGMQETGEQAPVAEYAANAAEGATETQNQTQSTQAVKKEAPNVTEQCMSKPELIKRIQGLQDTLGQQTMDDLYDQLESLTAGDDYVNLDQKTLIRVLALLQSTAKNSGRT